MSPRKQPARAPRGGRRSKRRGRGAMVALALLGVLAAGMTAAAMYFGFVPGPDSWLGRGAAADTARRDTVAAALDSAGIGGADSVGQPGSGPDFGPGPVPGPVPGPGATTVTLTDSAAGDAVYRGVGRCVACHGPTGEGVVGLGPSLRASNASLEALARLITAGAPPSGQYRIAMPAYGGQLASDDVAKVAAFVYVLAHPGSIQADVAVPPPTDGAVNADAIPAAPRPIRPTVPPPNPSPNPAPSPARRP